MCDSTSLTCYPFPHQRASVVVGSVVTMLRSLARPLLASWFVYGAVESLVEPATRAARSTPVVKPVLDEVGLDVDVEDLVRIHGAATLAAAATLAMSRTPRTAGLALAGLTAVMACAGRPFWLIDDEQVRASERERFVINLSLLGGTMLAATAGHSARHQARKKKRRARARAKRRSA